MKLRPAAIAWLVAVLFAMVALFTVKYETYDLVREQDALEREERVLAEDIRVLRSEWSYLTRPARIARLAETHLPLEPIRASQLVQSAQYLPAAAVSTQAATMELSR